MAKVVSVCVTPALARRIRVAGALSGQSMSRKATSLVVQWLGASAQVSAVDVGTEQVKLTLSPSQMKALRVAAAEGGWDSASALARAVLDALCPHELEAVVTSMESSS